MVAPDITYHSTKFQFNIIPLSKVILTHVNSTYTPSWSKTHPTTSHIGYHKYTPKYMPIKHCQNIDYQSRNIDLKFTSINPVGLDIMLPPLHL